MVNGRWLPFLVDGPNSNAPAVAKVWDVIFLGNLNTPNNYRGLEWFLNSVYPMLQRSDMGISVLIAGSNPSSEFRRLFRSVEGITVIENPLDSAAVLAQGRVLINPILSGSGVNIKSIEMLFQDAHLVTTPIGVRGFPDDVRQEFSVADTPTTFARAILASVSVPYQSTPSRETARLHFNAGRISDVLNMLTDYVGRDGPTMRAG